MATAPRELPQAAVIYGAGSFGRRLREQLESVGVEVVGIIDQAAPQRSTDLRWFSLGEIDQISTPVIIGISNPMTDIRPIAALLQSGGVSDVWSPVEASKALFDRGATLENYWMTGDTSIFKSEAAAIESARGSLADEASKICFEDALRYRETGAIEHLSSPCPLEQQYFPPDVPFIGTRMRYVDVGAYDGDTVRALAQNGADLEALIALEPDVANFVLMADVARELSSQGIEVIAAPLGLSDRCEMVSFSGDGTAASSISTHGDVFVQCVSLDALAQGWGPTHVKMDIEGAEAAAIAGMGETLRQYGPNLAISAYHRPQDLWSLLHTIRDLNLGYRFWLRTYGYQTFDIVLYCTQVQASNVK